MESADSKHVCTPECHLSPSLLHLLDLAVKSRRNLTLSDGEHCILPPIGVPGGREAANRVKRPGNALAGLNRSSTCSMIASRCLEDILSDLHCLAQLCTTTVAQLNPVFGGNHFFSAAADKWNAAENVRFLFLILLKHS